MSNILLASEGRAFSRPAIAQAAALAGRGGTVKILAIARIWGVALGFPNPWLLPSKQEWAQQRDNVAAAIAKLEALGVEASGNVLATRNPSKRIAAEAARLGCSAIVMAADAPRHQFFAGMFWSQEPYRVKRRTGLPVHLVLEQ